MDRDALVQRNERRMADCRARMEAAAYDLGYYAYRSLDIPMGRKFCDAIRDKLMLLEGASRDRAGMESFCREYGRDSETLASIDSELADEEALEKETSLRLGTALYEQGTFGILDRKAFAGIYQDIEREKALAEGGDGRLVSKIASSLGKRKRIRDDEARFSAYADIAMAGNADISGTPAALLAQLRDITARASSLRIERDRLKEGLASRRAEYLRITKGGLEKQKDAVRKRDDEARDSIVSYGTFLYEKGASWVGEDTPEEVLALLERMLAIQNQQDSIAEERHRIAKAAKADDVQAMIDMEEDKIAMLLKEKERIEAEISSISANIARLRGRLENLGGEQL